MSAVNAPQQLTETTPTLPSLSLVSESYSPRKFSARMVFAAVLVLIIAFAVQLTMTMIIMQDAYRASELSTQKNDIERERTAALSSINSIMSPQNLAQQATQLGMVPNSGSTYLDLSTAQIIDAGKQLPGGVAAIDPSLVPNKLLEKKPEPVKGATNGVPAPQPQEPLVPSDFEVAAPTTH